MALLQLQHVDVERDAVMARLRQVLHALRGNPEVEAARVAAEAAEGVLASIEPKLRDNDLERRGLRDHIERESAKLYGGTVKLPKELQSLEAEVSSLKRRLATLDDTSLQLMLDRDEAEANLGAARERLAAAETDAAGAQQSLGREKVSLARTLKESEGRRADAAAELGARDLATYERVRARKGGVAVAEVRGVNCTVCSIQVPRALIEQAGATAGEFAMCPGCGRILCA